MRYVFDGLPGRHQYRRPHSTAARSRGRRRRTCDRAPDRCPFRQGRGAHAPGRVGGARGRTGRRIPNAGEGHARCLEGIDAAGRAASGSGAGQGRRSGCLFSRVRRSNLRRECPGRACAVGGGRRVARARQLHGTDARGRRQTLLRPDARKQGPATGRGQDGRHADRGAARGRRRWPRRHRPCHHRRELLRIAHEEIPGGARERPANSRFPRVRPRRAAAAPAHPSQGQPGRVACELQRAPRRPGRQAARAGSVVHRARGRARRRVVLRVRR